jgi:threonine aldolase
MALLREIGPMNFTSDNCYGAAAEVIDAVRAANDGATTSYGEDELTARLNARMAELFEHDVAVFPVVTGTAANALALATLTPPHGAIVCHPEAHIVADECGAPEFFSNGARLVLAEGANGKITPSAIELSLRRIQAGLVHHLLPTTVSVTQATECGTCYRPEEISAISAFAKSRGLKLHMDGARFANALAHLGCSPADATWRAGVDVMSFGGTKNGALSAEAVVFFDATLVSDFEYRRKRSGHLVSKMRFVSAQLLALIEGDTWLRNARRANALAQKLAEGLSHIEGTELAYPVDANSLFVHLPDSALAKLRETGAEFLDWATSENGRTLVRLVCSFATPDADVDKFLKLARSV